MNPWLNMGYQLQPYGGAPVTPSPMMQPPVMPQTGMQAGMLGMPEGLTPGMLQYLRSIMPQQHGSFPMRRWMNRGFGGMGDARGRPGGYGGPAGMGGMGGMGGSYGGGTGRTANGNSNSLGGGGLY